MRPRAGRGPARSRSIPILAALAFASMAAAATAAPSSAQARAVLESGPDPVKGLPFFGANAIASLRGVYALDGAPAPGSAAPAPIASGGGRVTVWYSRESLVLSGSWKRLDQGAAGYYADAAYGLERGAGSVLALKFGGYSILFELSGDGRGSAFARAFSSKFAVFFRGAAGDAELSFPAFVDY